MTLRRHTGDRVLDQLQLDVQRRFSGLDKEVLLGARVIPDVAVSATATPVQTGMARIRGYIVCRSNADVRVYDQGTDNGTIQLVASGAATISLLVF